MSVLSCLNDRKNIGKSSCKKIPGLIKGLITTPDNFSLTFENAATTSNWQNQIVAAKANRIYYWPTAVSMENVNEEAVYEETTLATMRVRDGRYRFRLMFQENLEVHKAIFSHQGFEGRIFLIDDKNQIIGTTLPSGEFAGFSIDLLNPEKLMMSDGSVSSKTPVYVSLEDNRELDDAGAMIEGSSILRALLPLTSVDLTVNSASATEVVVNVESTLDNADLLGLVAADFVLLDGSGSAQTISGVTDNEDGTYTLAGSGLVSGSVNLVAANALSITGFESTGPATVTIS